MGTYAYDKANARFIGVKLNRKTDADIIAHLEKQKGIQSYIKRLIRADIAAPKAGKDATSEDHL